MRGHVHASDVGVAHRVEQHRWCERPVQVGVGLAARHPLQLLGHQRQRRQTVEAGGARSDPAGIRQIDRKAQGGEPDRGGEGEGVALPEEAVAVVQGGQRHGLQSRIGADQQGGHPQALEVGDERRDQQAVQQPGGRLGIAHVQRILA